MLLLVEDSAADADLVREALADSHLLGELHVVTDGVEALDFLYRRGAYAAAPAPDLILLDFNLPRLDGRGVLAEVKHDPALSDIPVVVLTSSAAEQDVAAAYRLRANCYVTKPVGLTQFWAAIRQIEQFWFALVKLPPRPGVPS